MIRRICEKFDGQRIISLFLAVVMAFSMIPIINMTVMASPGDTRVSDPSTLDGWEDFFGSDVLSTENAGGIWTDKSVLTSAEAFAGTGIVMDGTDNESFLVALSAIASNTSVTGKTSAPTDTMLVLDVSGSMNNNQGNHDAAEDLVNAANTSIANLLNANKNNRVGVVLYSGTSSSSTNNNAATLVLPLGRYTTNSDGKYLSYTDSRGTETITLDTNVVIENTNNRPASTGKEVVGATYIQKGIHLAKEQFVADSNETTVDGMGRLPVLVLMSDGSPTLSTTDFTNPGQYNLGDGTASSTSAAQGFVTQLTAAYAKQQIEAKYGTDLLFYTLGFKVDQGTVAESVLDPSKSLTGINDLWDDYNKADNGSSVVVESTGEWVNVGTRRNPRWEWQETTLSVTKITETLNQQYVTKYFSASNDLQSVFESIISESLLQSKYYPTLVETHEDLDGYVSFVDKIGNYMEVTDIKGILIHNTLFSGADLSSNFVSGGGKLGTFDNPTELGNEMVAAVQQRLGISDIDTARTLIGLAYEHGQLSYTSPTEFSNYIGWYANAAGKYLGFWDEGSTTIPEPTGNVDTDPVFYIKSYGYLGEVDAEHGVTESDMMYATVQVRENIQTGEETVVFAIPAALIPVVSYDVTLDENNELENLEVSGAKHPIRLVYEVALDKGLDEITISDPNVVDPAYITANTNTDGSVNFYTNQYDVNNNIGYGTVNTYSYFRPSTQNERYYFQENATIYTDTNGTVYQSTTAPNVDGVFYHAYQVYSKNGSLATKTIYRQLSKAALETALQAADNTWYIPAGNIHVNLDGFTVYKTDNPTDTLTETFDDTDPSNDRGIVNEPFVDVYGHNVNDTNHRFVVGATLGNNGKLTVTPATGIKLSKTVENEGGSTPTATAFTFVITGSSADAGKTYPARIVYADGSNTDTSVQFGADGKATVNLNDGETLYITGMTAGAVYTISETENEYYILSSVNGDKTKTSAEITVAANTLSEAAFVNTERGQGTLTITKFIEHNLGENYQIPADKKFNITVTLSGIGTANKTFEAQHSAYTDKTSVTTDSTGSFTVVLEHAEQIEIFGLPTGTVATVVENNPGEGFTATYLDNGQNGDGIVEIAGVSSVVVQNTYAAKEVYPVNIEVGGTKYLENSDGSDAVWGDAEFTVVLQRYGANGWEDVGNRITLNSTNQTFKFDVSTEKYTAPGVYAYQVFEVEPADGDKIDGMFYDNVWHTFSVTVNDADMDGQLEITGVHSDHTGNDFTQDNGVWKIVTNFTNVQHTTAPALAVVDVQKLLVNDSGSSLVSLAGYEFGLYTDEGCTQKATVGNGVTSIESAFTDTLGEGQIDIIFDTAGNYTYYVKEVAGTTAGMTYSDKVVKVDITVAHGAGGRLSAAVAYNTETNSDNELEFTNSYAPDDVTVDLGNYVKKQLIGRAMNEKDVFTFEVQSLDGNTTYLTGTNDVNGKVTFNDVLTFNKVGYYDYRVVETSAGGKGITTDTTIYNVRIAVTDAGDGKLAAALTIVDVLGTEMVFKNTYTTTPAEYTVTGDKTLNGKALLNDEFTFVLSEANADGTIPTDAKIVETQNFADGHFVFEKLTFSKTGDYYYVVTEKTVSAAHYIQYDSKAYLLKITVSDNGEGALQASLFSITVMGDNTEADRISFVNSYKPNSTNAEITGNKILAGKVLSTGNFSFELYESDSAWNLGQKIEVVSNGANGDFVFTKLGVYDEHTDTYIFDKAGSFYYLVKEQNGGKEINGVFYDPTVYRVRIDVTDDLKGQLHSTVHIYNEQNIPHMNIGFRNFYRVTTGDTVTLSGTKTLTGLVLENNMFSFNLYEATADFDISTKLDTATNTGKDFKFEIEYDPEDVGKTFYYVVMEDKGGTTVDGLTYDSSKFNVTVTVEDNGDGALKTTVNIANGPIAFTNTYTAEATSVDFEGTKVLEGIRKLKADDFTFDIYNANDQFEIAGAAVQSVKNDKDGNFTFTDIPLNEAKTYRFVIKENSQTAIGGVTYDSNEYHITVVVKDDAKGKLYVQSQTVSDKTGKSASSIRFLNTYSADAATVNLSGKKELAGRTLAEGEFAFLLYAADNNYSVAEDTLPVRAVNASGGGFVFDALTFNTEGTYYYVISEDTGINAERVTFDNSVYHVSITVKDNGAGKLVADAPVIVKKGGEAAPDGIVFNNIYTPRPTNLNLNITAKKTVKNIGSDSIGPEGFEFVLSNLTTGASSAAIANADGLAVFGLVFTEDDIGKVYTYKLTETNDGKENVIYSTSEYNITITILLNNSNELVATITDGGNEVETVVAEFENVYDYTPTPPASPQTGDYSNVALWFALMLLSGGGLATTVIYSKNKRKKS